MRGRGQEMHLHWPVGLTLRRLFPTMDPFQWFSQLHCWGNSLRVHLPAFSEGSPQATLQGDRNGTQWSFFGPLQASEEGVQKRGPRSIFNFVPLSLSDLTPWQWHLSDGEGHRYRAGEECSLPTSQNLRAHSLPGTPTQGKPSPGLMNPVNQAELGLHLAHSWPDYVTPLSSSSIGMMCFYGPLGPQCNCLSVSTKFSLHSMGTLAGVVWGPKRADPSEGS